MLNRITSVLFILVILFLNSRSMAQSENELPQPLSDEEFKALIQSSDTADWAKIRVLTDAQAKMLTLGKGVLSRVGTLHEDRRGLWLSGLVSLTDKQAKELAKPAGFLCLDGLSTLTDRQFKELCRYKGGYGYLTQTRGGNITTAGGLLCLNGLDSISDVQSESILKLFIFEVQLNGITSLSDKQAGNLASFEGNVIQLSGLRTLSDSQAKSLAQFQGKILFRALDSQSKGLFKKYGGSIFGEKP